jgi:hypothetical protein
VLFVEPTGFPATCRVWLILPRPSRIPSERSLVKKLAASRTIHRLSLTFSVLHTESQPWNLIARGFGPGTSGYPGVRFPHLKIYRIWHFLVTLHCPKRSFFLACLTNRYLLPKNYI